MAPVHRTCSNVEQSGGDPRSKRRRRRRRRCKGKGWSNTFSTLIRPMKAWDSAAPSAEDADNSSSSSLEVKENQEEKTLVEQDFLKEYHLPTFCSFSKHKQRTLKRQQLLVDGRDLQFFQNHMTCKRSARAAQKSAVVQLNELRPGLRYETVSKTGPLHAPVFSVSVEINGFHFEGRGPTKKQAKLRAAELALRSFVQFPNPSQTQGTVERFTRTTVDFTADKLDLPDAGAEESFLGNYNLLRCDATRNEVLTSISNHKQTIHWTLDLDSSTNPSRAASTSKVLEHLSPVELLNELRPGLRYMCQVEKVHGRPMRNFIMAIRLEGRVFEGCGRSKRRAKVQAAAAALRSLYNIGLGSERNLTGLQGSCTKNQLPQFFAESIYNLVKEKYSQLIDSCSSASHLHHKALAGIVMTRGFDLGSSRVVSLATGTKCLDLDHLSELGWTLRDCHAEVLSRRALLRFLYRQLELLNPAAGEEQSVFVPNKSCAGSFRLRDDVVFHMYVSSSPCGDARLNCPYETTTAHPSRRFCCHLRVKVNGGEGTLPVTARGDNQKLDAAAAPCKPATSMSCTDKIAKWSVAGLQGALLSHLVEPIYLSSLTVGTLSHTGHLGRVMACRLAPVKRLTLPYRRQPLLLGCLSSREVHPAGKTSNVSVNWSCSDGGLEEVSTTTGRRRDSGTPSRLCRRSLFTCWLRLQEQLNGPFLGPEGTTGMYSSSKMAAGHYQRAVQQFSSSLQGGVTVPCGHNNCRSCIKGFWDEEEQTGIHSCPQCRQTATRPSLSRNSVVGDLLKQLMKILLQAAPADHCYAGPEDVSCDVCSGRKLKAIKSCLVCLASYCEKHLQPHYESAPLQKHKLVEASKNLQENICSCHDEVMKMFCRTDQKCICYLCSVDERKDQDTVSTSAERTEDEWMDE